MYLIQSGLKMYLIQSGLKRLPSVILHWIYFIQFVFLTYPKNYPKCLFICVFILLYLFSNLTQRLKSSFHVLHKPLTKNYPIVKTNI